ncbi:MAG: MCE family protein, partial [Candidatus Nitrosotenuis sp.]
MHYIHRLTPGQKNAAIAVFAGIPVLVVLFLAFMWGVNRGMFTKMATLRTTITSAQGIDTQTPITYSGMKIGRVSGIQLGKKQEVELTLTVERAYLERLHRDAVAIIASASVIGIKEIRITGGSESAPLLNDGDTITAQGLFDMDNMMERVTPILNAAEKIVFRIEKILNGFPDERLNAAITDVGAVMGSIRAGKSTA